MNYTSSHGALFFVDAEGFNELNDDCNNFWKDVLNLLGREGYEVTHEFTHYWPRSKYNEYGAYIGDEDSDIYNSILYVGLKEA